MNSTKITLIIFILLLLLSFCYQFYLQYTLILNEHTLSLSVSFTLSHHSRKFFRGSSTQISSSIWNHTWCYAEGSSWLYTTTVKHLCFKLEAIFESKLWINNLRKRCFYLWPFCVCRHISLKCKLVGEILKYILFYGDHHHPCEELRSLLLLLLLLPVRLQKVTK